MLMTKNKLLIFLLLTVVLGTGVSGCGNSRPADKSPALETDNTSEQTAENRIENPEKAQTIETADKAESVLPAQTTPAAVEIAAQPHKNEELKVTFIELGSVKCIPCKMMQPIMDEIEKEYPGQVKVVFYDVWTQEGQPYAGQYGIRSIPTQVFLDKDGKEYYRHTGYFPKEELVKIL